MANRFVWIQFNQEGFASYHLGTNGKNYIKYELVDWKLDNGDSVPTKKHFINDHLDYKEKKFTGTIDWSSNTFDGDVKWVFEMNFREDWGTIVSGSVVSIKINGEEEILKYGPDLNYNLLRRAMIMPNGVQ